MAPNPIAVDTTVEAGPWGDPEAWRPLIERVVAAVAVRPELDVPDAAELSLLLTDDAHIRILNATWRGRDAATNVLSFPSAGDDEDPGPLLGDVVVAHETTDREARADGRTFEDHFAHLLVHGLLHLFGFDHEDDAEAEEMEALETEILAGIGVADPYAQADD
ncbi:rRNA maturation RNase YbeY [Siculibacillus lacustris]|uniref:Endoribonuclease YbeY n=1 Tax=Siculibacillus lacustris TaxID=1549641 RepID=A0A4Q9VNS2_9HYPH|nr:rRNA maturation RNase YbeY [Siculibacillus lacustris]TBW36479.1 rRNA maturation RNase YbeY [Siculibacillus lacustris]